ncbi:MAG: DUF6165 family protein [Myxococcales bacterium]|nr:DUF6165 family protein [Myxococcales bacterium]
MMLRIIVSPGELLDKISILQIKQSEIRDTAALAHVEQELSLLVAERDRGIPESPELAALVVRLDRANRTLWDVEDRLRRHERDADFGATFIALARSVYHTNDERAAAKRRINELLGSAIVEEKCYVKYA